MWFYSLPQATTGSCLPVEKIYDDYFGAVKYGNIFSIDVGPDYNGQLRKIDVEDASEGEPDDSRRRTLDSRAIAKRRQEGECLEQPIRKPQGYEPDKAVDGDASTRWGADNDALSGWLEVDLGQPTLIRPSARSGSCRPWSYGTLCDRMEDVETWKTLAAGAKIDGTKGFQFAAGHRQACPTEYLEGQWANRRSRSSDFIRPSCPIRSDGERHAMHQKWKGNCRATISFRRL